MKKDIASRINVFINLSIFGLLVYLAVMVKDLHTEMVNPEGFMKPAAVTQIELDASNKLKSGKDKLQSNIIDLLNKAMDEAKAKEVQ